MKNKQVKILLAEDEEDQRIRLKYVLESEGYIVTEAESGDKAVEILKKADQYFNVVITDLKMPGEKDGLDVLKETIEISPNTDVFVVTAYGTVDSAVRAMINGAFDYIQKPVNIPELRIKIIRALKNREILDRLDSKEILANNMEALSREAEEYKEKLKDIFKLSERILHGLKKNSADYDMIHEIMFKSKV